MLNHIFSTAIVWIPAAYLAIGFALHLSSKFTMPQRQASPGQLELDFAVVEPPAAAQLPAAAVGDPWTLPLEEPIAVPTIAAAVEPLYPPLPYLLLLLPAAAEMPTDAQTEPIAAAIRVQIPHLRSICTRIPTQNRHSNGRMRVSG